jgi:AcrR family transcriptional regulator
MTNQTKETVIEITRSLIIENGADTLTLEKIAETAKIPLKKLNKEFESIDQITLALTKKRLAEQETQSKKIVALDTPESFITLLRHDLKLVYALERDRREVYPKGKYLDSFALFDEYFDIKMPMFYFEIFKKHPQLVPDRSMDRRLYAHFVVHSIYFFRTKQLQNLTHLSLDLEALTRQLISSLFTAQLK